jgi:hypothetical protein
MRIVHRDLDKRKKRQGFQQTAQSAFDSGAHRLRPEQPKGKPFKWHWLPRSTPLRILVDRIRNAEAQQGT